MEYMVGRSQPGGVGRGGFRLASVPWLPDRLLECEAAGTGWKPLPQQGGSDIPAALSGSAHIDGRGQLSSHSSEGDESELNTENKLY